MIGVVSIKDEIGVVEEFFQLFKTPWEMYRAGESYDVLLVTGEEIPKVNARLVLIFGAGLRKCDQEANLTPRARRHNVRIEHRGAQFPLYGEVVTFEKSEHRVVCKTSDSDIAGIEFSSGATTVQRIGYDLFQEIAFLLTAGQPVENADVPTLELHVAMLRDLILDAGISVLEIPPSPAGYDFSVCLTHDIDFVGIRRHKFDHTMWGFLFRATVGAACDALTRKITFARLIQAWKAAASLPFVYLGWMKDFWVMFDWYLKVEKGLSPTYFFIPFKRRAGDKDSASHPGRRASAYDIGDVTEWTDRLQSEGCEVGVHGIDAWHSVDKGREELKRVAAVTGQSEMGIRMHWLLRNENTYRVLEEAGYSYDSTAGYNEAPGYRCGTTQTFRPLKTRKLLELPMHIQDGALFFANRLGLSEPEAWRRCETFISNAKALGGVLTVLWHDRSPGPERFWGDFYIKLVQNLKSQNVWFGTAGQVVSWFRQRREAKFERVDAAGGTSRIRLRGRGQRVEPPLRVRIYCASNAVPGEGSTSRKAVECAWGGESDIEADLVRWHYRRRASRGSVGVRAGMRLEITRR